jgi:hypothetical protein
LPWLGRSGGPEFAQWILDAYVQELGDHLKPVARGLAGQIMDGSAGDVPAWGYKLLARFPDESLPVLTAGLMDRDLVRRERAAVALGYMGSAAAAAKAQVSRALASASGDREQRLLKWCLREID